MDLDKLLAQYKDLYGRIRLADPNSKSDNERILEFFENNTMESSGLTLRYTRSPDFFAFLRNRSDLFFVFVYEDISNQIKGVGSISIRDGFIDGVRTKVGYLGDLRVQTNRRLALTYRKLYGDLIYYSKEIFEFQGCHRFLTVVINGNEKAENALLHRNQYRISKDRSRFEYRKVVDYSMVNLILKYPEPFKRKGTPSLFSVKNLSQSEWSTLELFWAEENMKIPFGFDSSELARRLNSWPDLERRNFWAAFSETGEILACFAIWDPKKSKRIIVEKLAWTMKVKLQAFKVLGKPSMKVGKHLEVLYLSHLVFASHLSLEMKNEVFSKMLEEINQAGVLKRCSVLSFCEFQSLSLSQALKGWLHEKVGMSLFQVVLAESSPSVSSSSYQSVGFEMALV